MDINSLLSPQDTPAGSPSPRSTPVASRRSKSQTGIPNVKASPLSKTINANAFPPPTMPSPPINSLPQNVQQAALTPSPASRSPPQGRPSSTTGMDALADLASMQHHQRMARVNSGGVRGSDGQDKQVAPTHSRPSLEAIARTHSGSRSSLDIRMGDAPAQTPPPRTFRSSSLADEDLEQVRQLTTYLAENPNAYDCHAQLLHILHRGLLHHVYGMESLPQNDPRTYDLLGDLQQAAEAMTSRFCLGEELWQARLQDQELLARSLEDCLEIVELYEKAVAEETGSTKLWKMYGEWMLALYSKIAPDDNVMAQISNSLNRWNAWSDDDMIVGAGGFGKSQMLETWKRGAEEVTYNLNDSNSVWDKYLEILLLDLGSTPSGEALATVHSQFVNRLQVPHATWDNTFQKFSGFISTYKNDSYESIMTKVNASAAKAKAHYGLREEYELKLSKALDSSDQGLLWQVFTEYLEWELSLNRKKKNFSFELANALYQRAVRHFPGVTDLWQDYLALFSDEGDHREQPMSSLSLLGNACSHCPWSGILWSLYIQAAERHKLPFADIGQIKHKATSTGLLDSADMEDVLKIHTSWCNFLRRRAFAPEATEEEDPDVAELGIVSAIEEMDKLGQRKEGKEYKGDRQYRLERIYIKFLDQGQKYDQARERWKGLIDNHADSYEFWLRYYWWEMITWGKVLGNQANASNSIPKEATKVLKRAARRTRLDWPEKIYDTYLTHCEDHEDAAEIQEATVHWRKAMKALAKRREQEAVQIADATQLKQQQQQQQQVEQDCVVTDSIQNGINGSKRKIDEVDDTQAAESTKRSRLNGADVEQPSATTESLLKRDRENASIIVKSLPGDTTEKGLRSFFKECGTIKSLTLSSEEDGSTLTANIEFDSKEDALAAQTKDMKKFRGSTIGVQTGTGTTLYVTNFPPSSDELYIRSLFEKYGEIADIRFPSLKYNTHRRFCYVQFKSAEDAQKACELDGQLVNGLKLLAKMSDPTQKEKRHGPMHEGREVYASNVDWSATEKNLKEIFAKYGTVESVRIPKNLSGKSKGMAFIVFSSKDEAQAALDLNNTKFKSRILTVSISTANPAKRQATTLINSRTSASPPREQNGSSAPSPLSATSPPSTTAAAASSTTSNPTREEIASRTVALLNVPDIINDSRIRALMEPYGALTKITLRPDHQGAVVEFVDVNDAGKAALAIDGHEIAPGRRLGVGSVPEMLAQKAEIKDEKKPAAGGSGGAKSTQGLQGLQPAAPVRRPGQPGAGRRGGLGKRVVKPPAVGAATTASGEGGGGGKTNADFKAMINKGKET